MNVSSRSLKSRFGARPCGLIGTRPFRRAAVMTVSRYCMVFTVSLFVLNAADYVQCLVMMSVRLMSDSDAYDKSEKTTGAMLICVIIAFLTTNFCLCLVET